MRSTVDSVGESVAALRAALRTSSVEAIDAQIPVLQQAAVMLERLAAPECTESASRRELEAVEKELRAAKKMIVHGQALTQGMARLLVPAAEYQQDGEPAPVQPLRTLLVRG
jgi:hypothetical protein